MTQTIKYHVDKSLNKAYNLLYNTIYFQVAKYFPTNNRYSLIDEYLQYSL